MDEHQKQIVELKTKITNLEGELQAAKRALFELTENPSNNEMVSGAGKVIEGTFNGENMIGPEGKVYPVPANYASKSKLIEGDRLKLSIGSDGSFLFKQIGPIERKKLIGVLKFENNTYVVEAEGRNYHILYASVTYHKAKPGDKVAVAVPAVGESAWCALESVIHEVAMEEKPAVINMAEEVLPEEIVDSNPPPTTESIFSEPNSNESTIEVPVEVTNPIETPPPVNEYDTAKSELGIDDLEISGPKGTFAPEAVDPQSFNVPPNQIQTPTSSTTTTVDTRADSISELEI
jgi:hypothetical protein